MTPAQVRTAINRLGLNQTELARLLRIEVRTVRRWVAQEDPIRPPRATELLFWLLLTGKLDVHDIVEAECQLANAEGPNARPPLGAIRVKRQYRPNQL
jgi:plasmid maintenance system antidote protein VapI